MNSVSNETNPNGPGLQPSEKEAIKHLTRFWNAWVELESNGDGDSMRVVRDAVHVIQGEMARRVARRVDPDVWL